MRRSRSGLFGTTRSRRANLRQSVIYRPATYCTTQWCLGTDGTDAINENIVAINAGNSSFITATTGLSNNVQAFYLNYSDAPGINIPPIYAANSRIKAVRTVRVWAYAGISGTATTATMNAYYGINFTAGYGSGYPMSPVVGATSSSGIPPCNWVSADIPTNFTLAHSNSGIFGAGLGNAPIVGLSISLAKSGVIYLDTLYVEYLGDIE